MAKLVKRLKDLQVKRLSKSGAYPDGEGLYLQVRDSGAKDWFYRYEVAGKGRKRGLGSYPTISLDQARDDALECRQLRKSGIDPIDHFKSLELEKDLEKAKSTTFKECAESYIDTHRHGWKDKRHESQWRKSLENNVGSPIKPVADGPEDGMPIIAILILPGSPRYLSV